jgi:hypothetical protein
LPELLEGDLLIAAGVDRLELGETRLHEFRARNLAVAVEVGIGKSFRRDVDLLGPSR